MDGEGRIIVSDAMRAHAGIVSDLTFVGMGPKFQIWEPTRFRAYLAEAKDQVRAARRQLGPQTPTIERSAGARE
jgi:MraZ protein